jgi:hypothetical protein
MEACRLNMDPWRVCKTLYRPAFADSHHFDNEQDPDPQLSEKLDLDPHFSAKAGSGTALK